MTLEKMSVEVTGAHCKSDVTRLPNSALILSSGTWNITTIVYQNVGLLPALSYRERHSTNWSLLWDQIGLLCKEVAEIRLI